MYALVQVIDSEERMEGLDSESDSCVCSVAREGSWRLLVRRWIGHMQERV